LKKVNNVKKELLKERLHEIIFEADTIKGKIFDVLLLGAIVLSVVVVSLETLPNLSVGTKKVFYVFEWILTIFFTIEYALRLYVVHKPIKYAMSFYGVIDLLSILPTYLSIVFAGTNSLMVIRAMRLLRLFRIFKMGPYLNQGNILTKSIKASIPKLTVFVYFVLLVVCIFGAIMYMVEGPINEEFDSIPRSIYWAIVTVTTVGYGDISPVTALGQFLSAVLMIIGYAVIAVPTGIISAEIVQSGQEEEDLLVSTQSCRHCTHEGHDVDAIYCKFCGEELNAQITQEEEE